MPLYVDRERVPDVSKKCGLLVNTIRQPKNSLLGPEDECPKIPQNPDNYIAVGTELKFQKT